MKTNPKTYCTDIAWQRGVPLIGTATRGDIWFLIEYPGRWEAKAFEQSKIPAAVKSQLMAISQQVQQVRILLIRQPQSQQRAGIKFFVAQTGPLTPRLYGYDLKDYQEISGLDLVPLAAGEAGDSAHLREDPIFLVCTNGRRDQCCAVYGPEVYHAIAKEEGDAVWQSSHIGGHNQAPITLFFPHGVNYGHTTPSEARRLVRVYRKNEVVLHHYRGRVGYETHIQAAEHFWREQTGILGLPGMQVDSDVETGLNRWAVTISAMDGSRTTCIHLSRRESDYKIPITCSGKKESTISTFHRVDGP